MVGITYIELDRTKQNLVYVIPLGLGYGYLKMMMKIVDNTNS